ncbi:MAG: 50S ribosomal protein L6 [Methylococcaceae bacterium]|nr:50S ribosomal protein L6 [Methylococcaceae bacterium]MCI0668127.1 50S ribosomal protein L6 [Methylococcaceae bacterium]MCI0733164.1 50S ribosomal protein L6 [Methylococcaceae bacterium]
MSRIANNPIPLPSGVDAKLDGGTLIVKGRKGELRIALNSLVSLAVESNEIRVSANGGAKQAQAMAGTTRSLVNNMVVGVSNGYVKKLNLVGVGYRAQVKEGALNLSLGFSHPVEYIIPEGISIETPSQTEIVVSGINKQRVGQVAADIRGFRPPEPYKGKGVRYSNETVLRKEAKKK